ncbi:sensor histidine kinase [Amycolatopsis rubida]|uniref:histidine kinase n=1 Tax=Amycolatopsis rubida TaxID=112413 RepID=A0A1I5UV03_9PSEU|nr:histidine kinase [Amycolatopsis rubida]SFP98546.1 Signal transduction histidine kinase [Amycolatopsis rubida]
MRWFRDRKSLLDLGTAVLVAVLLAVGGAWPPATGWDGVALVSAQVLPLAFRRRFPGWVLALVTAATLARLLTTQPHNIDYVPVLIALYTVPSARRASVRWGLGGLSAAALGAAMTVSRGPVDGALLAVAVCVVAWLLGTERQRHAAERAEFAAQRTRFQLERLAAERREQTARRLHDTLARTTTVMLVQAEALLAVGELTSTDRARVDAMLAAGRDALGQVRETLRELRDDGQQQPGPAVAAVLAELTAAGLVIEEEPALHRIPDQVRDLADRIVSEAAINALRHNGPGVRLRVEVEVALESVRIVVRNDRIGHPTTGTGYGLDSLRIQLAARGGSLAAGPEGEGWSVTAVIPCLAAPAVPTR